MTGLPPTVKATPATIARGQNEARVTLTAAANAKPGPLSATFVGKARFQNLDVSANTLPVSLAVAAAPFDLKVLPAPIKLKQGEKVKVKVVVTRRKYQGPISVELRNLPAKVTATKGVVPQGQAMLELEVSAAADAALGNKAGVHAAGVATAAGNVTVNSPSMTLSVLNK